MYLTQIPFFPAPKSIYDIEKIKPNIDTLVKAYPELLRCLQCNTCTKSCPMDIEVMDYIAAAMVMEVEKGKYEQMLRGLMDTDEGGLKDLYNKREIEPEQAGEDWTPEDKTYL